MMVCCRALSLGESERSPTVVNEDTYDNHEPDGCQTASTKYGNKFGSYVTC